MHVRGFCNSPYISVGFIVCFILSFNLILLFECGSVSGRPVIKNHAPL